MAPGVGDQPEIRLNVGRCHQPGVLHVVDATRRPGNLSGKAGEVLGRFPVVESGHHDRNKKPPPGSPGAALGESA